jgi:O-antigen/teichoic acid export membrane protein
MTGTGTEGTEAEVDVLATGAAGGKAIRGGVLRTASYVGTLALGLVSVPLMTRHLGVTQYGYYVTVSSIVFIIGGFTEAGLTNLGIREYSTLSGAERAHYLRALAGLRFALTAVGVVAAFLFALVTGQPHQVVLGTAIAGLGLFLGLAQQTYAIPLTARLRFGWISLLDLVKQTILVGVIVACVVAGAGLVPFFWANVASGGAVLLATLVLIGSGEASLAPALDRATWKRVIRHTLPYTLSTVAALIYFRLGVILLGYVSNDHEVGIYSTAFRITEVLTPAAFIVVSSAFPILARAARDDSDRLRYALQKLFDGSLLLGSLIVLGLAVGARFAIEVIAPLDKFSGSVPMLRVQGIAILFTFIQATFSFALLSLERYRDFIWCNLVPLVVAASGTIALGPSMGGMGVAIATTTAEASLAVVYLVALRRARPDLMPGMGAVPRVALAGGIAALAVFLGLPSVVEAVIAGLVFVAVSWAVGAVPRELVAALLRRDPG